MNRRKKKRLLLIGLTCIGLVLSACKSKDEDTEKVIDSGNIVNEDLNSNSSNDTNDLIELSKKLCGKMAGGVFEDTEKLYSKAMKKSFTNTNLKDAWDSVVTDLGDYKGIYEAIETQEKEYQIVTVALEYQNKGLKVFFTYNKAGEIEGLFLNYFVIPNEGSVTENYAEENVNVPISIDGNEFLLSGMITRPLNQKEPVKLVILVQGSGQTDMNEEIGTAGNAIFRDLAHGLAERGIATLRYNKRYFQYPEKATDKITINDEVLDDVNSAISYATMLGEFSKIYIAGHSLGGMLAPVIAENNNEVAGIISLAGSPRSLQDIIYDQNEQVVNTIYGADTSEAKLLMDEVLRQYNAISELTIFDEGVFFGVAAPYWYSLNQLQQAETAKQLEIPMLFLQGKADFQVSVEKDYNSWMSILEGKGNVSFILYDNLNHLFMPTNGYKDESDYNSVSQVPEIVIEDMADWIIKN